MAFTSRAEARGLESWWTKIIVDFLITEEERGTNVFQSEAVDKCPKAFNLNQTARKEDP